MAVSKDHPDFSKAKFKARVLEMKGGEKVAFAFALARRGDELSKQDRRERGHQASPALR